MSDLTLYARFCNWWSPFFSLVKAVNVLMLNDFLLAWFPYLHNKKFLPWINNGRSHPLYRKTNTENGITVTLILGHPESLLSMIEIPDDIDEKEVENFIQSRWRLVELQKLPSLSHLNTMLILRHLIEIKTSQLFNNHLNIEVIHLQSGIQKSRISNTGICLVSENNVFVRYREVAIKPLHNLQSVVQYKTGQMQHEDDQIMIQDIIFLYPIFWFETPSIVKAFTERIFIPGQAFQQNPYHPIAAFFLCILSPILSCCGCARRILFPFAAQGLLRDKSATLIETRGGPPSSIFGHSQSSLESTLRFCGVRVESVLDLNYTSDPNFNPNRHSGTDYSLLTDEPFPPRLRDWDNKLKNLALKLSNIKKTSFEVEQSSRIVQSA